MKTRRQTRWITKDVENGETGNNFCYWWPKLLDLKKLKTTNNWHREQWKMRLNIILLDCSSVVYVNAFESKPNYHNFTIFLRMSSYSNLAIWMLMQICALISMFINNILPSVFLFLLVILQML